MAANSPYELAIQKLFTEARSKKYPKNQIIFYQGDPISDICIIEKGYVKAYTILDSGDTRTLFLLSPGDIFPIAFSSTMEWGQYSLKYFYQSLTDVEIRLIDNQTFKKTVDSNPKLTAAFLNYMAATNDAIITQLEMMKTKGAINRVAYLLPYLVKKLATPGQNGSFKLNIKLSHQEIADLTGLTRETTTQQVKKLEKDGVINQKRGTWVIKLQPAEEERLRG